MGKVGGVRFSRRLGIILVAALGSVAACATEDDGCDHHDQIVCESGVLFWKDGCGQPEETITQCECGCAEGSIECAAPCGCQRGTCDSLGRECGTWDDGCGGTVSCLPCPADSECDADGHCQAGCVASTCDAAGRECGTWDDGCGKTFTCLPCPTGSECDADGHCQAGCIATTCEAVGRECGTWDDGCGGSMTCGPCADGVSCGAEGRCEDGCVEARCPDLGKQCGTWGDGCGELLTCGPCPADWSCLADGTCEPPCVPKSCVDLDRRCGTWDDGCGGEARCGTCEVDQRCSGAGSCEPLCPGVRIASDGLLDLDLRAVLVTGEVRLAGNTLPDESQPRGTISFIAADAGGSVALTLGTKGSLAYAATLPPGVYRVEYAPNPSLCALTSPGAMPCVAGVLRDSVRLDSDGVLDLDIPVVRVRGRVTIGGGELPSLASDRGRLSFALAGGGVATTRSFGSAGQVDYELRLLPGTYQVGYLANPGLCTGRNTPPLPCNDGTIQAAVSLATDGVLDLEIPVAKVRGVATLKGSSLPTATGDRGGFAFALRGGGTAMTRRYGNDLLADYALSLFPGIYDVAFSGNALCTGKSFPPLPCNAGPVRSGIAIAGTGLLDLDLSIVRVEGRVTVAGRSMPAATGSRGSVSFTLKDGGTTATQDFGKDSTASYKLSLLAGRYDVAWSGNGLCGSTTAPPVPCNAGMLTTGVELAADGVLDLDVPMVKVQGRVTLDGGTLPAATSNRGSVVLALRGGGNVVTRELGTGATAAFAASVLPGQYDVRWSGNGLCDGRKSPEIPCNEGPVLTDLALTSDGVLDVDIRAVKVRGRATLEGGTLPVATGDRGSFAFGLVGGGSVPTAPLGPSGSTDYALTLLPGSYLVRHVANAALCGERKAAPPVPCADDVLLGCETLNRMVLPEVSTR